MNIFINQLGYLPKGQKHVVTSKKAKNFTIIDNSSLQIVYEGQLHQKKDHTSKETVWTGDFNQLETPGLYHIVIEGLGSSYPFTVETNVYEILLKQSIRFYYLQRCGIAIKDEESGLDHPPCHCDDAQIIRKNEFHDINEKITSRGGWHDAGDYGKYTTTIAYTVAIMLSAYELWPERFYDGQFNIPESGDGIPDILDEARVGIEWLLTMQRPDGAVYHKLSGKKFAEFVSPELDGQTRYIYGINTNDTAKFVAAIAIAARVYRKWDPGFSQQLKESALKAWDFLVKHDYWWDYEKSDDDGSGAYGLRNDDKDRLWAALELATLTDEDHFLKHISQFLKNYQPAAPDWKESAILGLFHYARSNSINPDLRKLLVTKIIKLAREYQKILEASGYRYSLGFEEFKWGSNDHGLSRGIAMIMADFLSPDKGFRETALAQLDFVLGVNPLAKSFVSGIGSDFVRNPHHRWTAATKKIIPGLMAGGPNNHAQSGVEPADSGPFSYADELDSYSSNEPAINYNASLVFMAAACLKL